MKRACVTVWCRARGMIVKNEVCPLCHRETEPRSSGGGS